MNQTLRVDGKTDPRLLLKPSDEIKA